MKTTLLDVEEAAAITQRHPETIRRHIRRGNLAGFKLGNAWYVYAGIPDGKKCSFCQKGHSQAQPLAWQAAGQYWHDSCLNYLLDLLVIRIDQAAG